MARQVTQRAGGDQTRERILDVAERLFASAGFDAVSMRQVGTDADVPFALVSYHFGSKLGLYKAVFKRRSGTLTTQRLDQLKSIELGPDLRENLIEVARALVEPLLLLRETESGRTFAQLLAREVHDPVEGGRGIVEEYLDPIGVAAVDVLRRAAPDVADERFYWAFVFAVGALSTNLAGTGRVERLSGGKYRADQHRVIDQLDNFIAGGLLGVLYPEKFLHG
ncbi:hypothetical protein ASE00_10000 [Sphingomonas sp. Root710]|uniref:TetR/AcrR family transcriptional regulator n=1 Tax=Sphingomonas sp. Root710 TaxID=1736594 RepID=UPI0006F70EAB|nr:TetR family transcriptional regulator [Sphingomonas sp. Root710]KRB82390.1 hypothetical protein ASE00_10000 [Sphingomonas sp. Root710]